MAKNIIFCADGTWNTVNPDADMPPEDATGTWNPDADMPPEDATNVYKLWGCPR